MAQEILAIITNQQLDIDLEIVHFAEQGCTIIPLNIRSSHIEDFINEAIKFDYIGDLLIHLESKDGFGWNNGDCTDPGDEIDYHHSLKTLIDRIRSMKLENFVLHYFSDFASMPADEYFIAVLEGKIVKESAMIRYNGLDLEDYQYFTQQIGMNPHWFSDETKYFRYADAEEVYRSQKSHETKRS